MHEAYRFEVAHEDLTFDLRPDHSLLELMNIICNEWLNDARDGDGGLFDHMWIVNVSGRDFIGPFDEDSNVRAVKLRDIYLSPGSTLDVTYDMGSTTYFTVRFISIEQISSDVQLPRRVQKPSVAVQYAPPAGSPDLNKIFPHADELLFGPASVAQWIIPFPCGRVCAGCVEAGPNAMSDVVFMPNKFESFKELLVAFNEAGKHQPSPGIRSDAFARMTFPKTLNDKDEKKYNIFKKELDEFEQYCTENGLSDAVPLLAMAGHPQDVMYRLCGPKEVVVRVNEENMAAVEDVNVEAAFPQCAKAYLDKRHLWISYRRGKMMICKGYGSSDRGIPKPGSVVAEARQLKVHSLHEFFCVAESLFRGLA